jgi:hypothetical protein
MNDLITDKWQRFLLFARLEEYADTLKPWHRDRLLAIIKYMQEFISGIEASGRRFDNNLLKHFMEAIL